MTISRRRLLTGSTATAAAGLLSACGSNTGRGGSGSSGGPALSHWYHQYGEPGTEQAVRRYAKAYDKADVTVQWRPGDYDRQTAAALLTESGPDVFEANGPNLDQIRGKQVLDLTELIEDVKDDYNPAVLTPKTHEGRVYGIPQVIDMQLLYYRKSLLADAKVDPPRTLDELVDAAAKLTTRDVKGLFLGNDAGVGALGGTPLQAAGLELVTDDGEVGFDDPIAARTLGKIHQLYADKSLLLGAPSDWSDPAAFLQGLTAMQWSGLWALPAVQKELGDDFGVLPFPKDGAGSPSVPVGAYGAAVSARARDKDAAKAYVKWLWVQQTAYQEDFALSYGFHIPARISLAKKAEKLKKGAAADAVRFATESGFPAQPLLWTPRNQTVYQDGLSRIIKDGADPDKELKSVVRKVRAELERVAK
ncbi:ABC transporter substrate-binding protein [Streptomyces cavernicola]|uniref:Sugar ABC transporter substrate-binding protein n=1 Tax=Streptomyces cavernicola TaxID=3043613 RepID=A0ABT6SEC0_9ACTN|nr:sugar ABC transporter substrate-binding protein [Streptomyces sp. B-S-A6]MDI3406319.1 sugar ABC transporter substrate-binding protein [Streptomyces sp. B-S-A6]